MEDGDKEIKKAKERVKMEPGVEYSTEKGFVFVLNLATGDVTLSLKGEKPAATEARVTETASNPS